MVSVAINSTSNLNPFLVVWPEKNNQIFKVDFIEDIELTKLFLILSETKVKVKMTNFLAFNNFRLSSPNIKSS